MLRPESAGHLEQHRGRSEEEACPEEASPKEADSPRKNAPSDKEEAKEQHRAVILSSSRSDSAGIGTVIGESDTISVIEWAGRTKWLPRLHRAGPSTSLDKSIERIQLWRYDSTSRRKRQVGRE